MFAAEETCTSQCVFTYLPTPVAQKTTVPHIPALHVHPSVFRQRWPAAHYFTVALALFIPLSCLLKVGITQTSRPLLVVICPEKDT